MEIKGYVWENVSGYLVGISFWKIYGISQDILGYLNRISFSGYVEKRYLIDRQRSPRTSHHIPPSPRLSEDIPWGDLPDARRACASAHAADSESTVEAHQPPPGIGPAAYAEPTPGPQPGRPSPCGRIRCRLGPMHQPTRAGPIAGPGRPLAGPVRLALG